MLGTIHVLAGGVEKGKWQFEEDMVGMITMSQPGSTTIDLRREIANVELLTEEKVKKLAGTAGWGLAGAVLLGPLGAIGGMLLGGNKKRICFACHLKGGTKFMGETDSKTWERLLAISFR